MYDYIVIGAGISGLFSAYQLSKQNKTFIILEQNDRKKVGGRANSHLFYGSNIPIGAGVGRKHKDIRLQSLLEELHIPFTEHKHTPAYLHSVNPQLLLDIWKTLKEQYNETHKNQTFRQFAIDCIGADLYKMFMVSTGYSDYENASAYDTLYHYGMEDNIKPLTILAIPWDILINQLCKSIGNENIKTNTQAQQMKKISSIGMDKIHQVITSSGTYECKNIICAVTISSILCLFPKHPIYKNIVSQPFLRIYGKFAKKSYPFLDKYIPTALIVGGLIEKIIPIHRETGIYMIVYNDNKKSVSLSKYIENTLTNRTIFCNLLKKTFQSLVDEPLELIAVRSFYWPEGTHYYKPLGNYKSREDFIKQAQHPEPNIYIVGEMISLHQGWVEGALESVHSIFPH